jgi:hypothetical protein
VVPASCLSIIISSASLRLGVFALASPVASEEMIAEPQPLDGGRLRRWLPFDGGRAPLRRWLSEAETSLRDQAETTLRDLTETSLRGRVAVTQRGFWKGKYAVLKLVSGADRSRQFVSGSLRDPACIRTRYIILSSQLFRVSRFPGLSLPGTATRTVLRSGSSGWRMLACDVPHRSKK